MVELGKALQTERIRRGLTLEEVSAKTRISLRVLKEMESGNFSNIQGQFYVNHFIREFLRAISQKPEEFLIAHSEQMRQISIEENPSPGKTLQKLQYYRFRKRRRLGIILFLILLLAIAYLLLGNQLESVRSWILKSPPPVETGAIFEPDWPHFITDDPIAIARSQTLPRWLELRSQFSNAISPPVLFKARFSQPCWARVQRSGRTEMSRVFQAGDYLEIRGYDLQITLGNPSVVQLNVNNKPEFRYEKQIHPVTFRPEPMPPYMVNSNESHSLSQSPG